jgi:hypothetical protein
MTNDLKVLDAYVRQARLYPALLTLTPLLLTAIAWFPGLITTSIGTTLLTILVASGALYGLSTLSRTQGRKLEKKLLEDWGGWPTTIWLRHRSKELNAHSRVRYHAFLSKNVPNLRLPTMQQEKRNPEAADPLYASAIEWLKERCRGREFPLVYKENIEYGFRRNLRGLRTIGLTTAIGTLALSLLLIVYMTQTKSGLSNSAADGNIDFLVIAALAVDAIAIFGWIFFVTNDWVKEAANQYARALLACCDSLTTASR